MRILLLVLLLVPQLVAARVYMCVDPVTNKASFTDKACEEAASREEVRVSVTNLESGRRSVGGGSRKTWNSQRDTRKTGNDHSIQQRNLYKSNVTASTD